MPSAPHLELHYLGLILRTKKVFRVPAESCPGLTDSASLKGSAQRAADSPGPSSSEKCAPCWTCFAHMQTSSLPHRSLWKPWGQSPWSSYAVDLQEDRRSAGAKSESFRCSEQSRCVSINVRKGGPNSTASRAFRFSFCLCRWSKIFNCMDINDGSLAAILKHNRQGMNEWLCKDKYQVIQQILGHKTIQLLLKELVKSLSLHS